MYMITHINLMRVGTFIIPYFTDEEVELWDVEVTSSCDSS